MPDIMRYRGVDKSGKAVSGRIEGSDRAKALAILRGKDIRVYSLHNGGGGIMAWLDTARADKTALSQAELLWFYANFQFLLGSGVPLDKALRLLTGTAKNAKVKKIVEALNETVAAGKSLSAAMAATGAFRDMDVGLIAAGEVSGALPEVMARLADHLQKSADLRSSLTSAMIYPATLLVAAIIAMAVILTFVVPQFKQVFADFKGDIPTSTQIVLSLSQAVSDHIGILLLGVLVSVLGVQAWLKAPANRERFHAFLLQAGPIGRLTTHAQFVFFASAMATMLNNGVPVLRALDISRRGLSNLALARHLSHSIQIVESGKPLSAALMASTPFPETALKILRIGEESGQLAATFTRLAEAYERDLTVLSKRFISVLEPALVLVMGGGVAGLIIPLLVGMMSITSLVK